MGCSISRNPDLAVIDTFMSQTRSITTRINSQGLPNTNQLASNTGNDDSRDFEEKRFILAPSVLSKIAEIDNNSSMSQRGFNSVKDNLIEKKETATKDLSEETCQKPQIEEKSVDRVIKEPAEKPAGGGSRKNSSNLQEDDNQDGLARRLSKLLLNLIIPNDDGEETVADKLRNMKSDSFHVDLSQTGKHEREVNTPKRKLELEAEVDTRAGTENDYETDHIDDDLHSLNFY